MVVLKNDYSHCPLKKRPLSACYDGSGGEQTEPQDLSIKCTKETTTSLHRHESLAKDINPQDSQISSTLTDVSCGGSNGDSSLLQGIQCPYPGDHASKRILMPNFLRQETRSKNLNAEGSSYETHALNVLTQRRFAQVIRTHDTSTPVCRKHVPSISLNSKTPISKSAVASDVCASPKHNLRQKDLNPHAVSNAEKHTLLLSEGNERTFSLPVNPMGTLDPNTCSRSHSTASASVANECIVPRVPPLEILYPSGAQSGGVQFPNSVSKHMNTVASSAEASNGLSSKCSSQNSSAPHRPWLVEGPARALPKPYNGRLTVSQAAHSGSLIVDPPRLWPGIVPFTWPVPPVLAPPQPSSPTRLNQQRECYSPGSESASSDGSSGSLRNDARYSCAECSKSYSTYSGLSKHKQFHCVALGAKSFACKHCEKVYTSLGALKMHIRTHTLPCKCPLCGKAFSRPWLLQGHIRTHTGEKPFQCPQCDRCFADRSNLRAHLQTHADIKKYACNTCHKTFSRMSLLNKHTEAACPAIHRRTLQ